MFQTIFKLWATPIDIIPVCVYKNHMTNVYSVKEAAQKLGLASSQVRRLLAKDEIKGKKPCRDCVVLDLTYTRKIKPKGSKK